MCIATKASEIIDKSSGTFWPDNGAARDIPSSFLAFQIIELNSTNESVGWISWQDLAYPTTDPKWSVQESITIS